MIRRQYIKGDHLKTFLYILGEVTNGKTYHTCCLVCGKVNTITAVVHASHVSPCDYCDYVHKLEGLLSVAEGEADFIIGRKQDFVWFTERGVQVRYRLHDGRFVEEKKYTPLYFTPVDPVTALDFHLAGINDKGQPLE